MFRIFDITYTLYFRENKFQKSNVVLTLFLRVIALLFYNLLHTCV